MADSVSGCKNLHTRCRQHTKKPNAQYTCCIVTSTDSPILEPYSRMPKHKSSELKPKHQSSFRKDDCIETQLVLIVSDLSEAVDSVCLAVFSVKDSCGAFGTRCIIPDSTSFGITV